MKASLLIVPIILLTLSGCAKGQTHSVANESADPVLKIEMHLSAFGVESDNFPSIDVLIDFTNGHSKCVKTFYNPANKDSLKS